MLKAVKQAIIYTLCAVEFCLFSWTYMYGTQGWSALRRVQQENKHLEERIALCKQESDTLENELVAWREHPFYKEKVAREQLQMAREHETIYYIK
ncbi:MAG TPA: septum formation initiator family protein [Candidatus Limnocylindria bacterium]|nr:septum formation initiator family protein [Candidatus Limnocylindria bacterium]